MATRLRQSRLRQTFRDALKIGGIFEQRWPGRKPLDNPNLVP
jgi:hypothetical protein